MHTRVLLLVLVGFIVGCGDDPKPPPPPPARPTITSFAASPNGPIPEGSSATLNAVFTGGTGVVNPGALAISSGGSVQVTPNASTTYTLVVTGSGGTASATATVTLNNGHATIGTAGGTVAAPDGATLTVPFGALASDTELSIRSIHDPPPSGVGATSPVYVLEPEGLLFARPVKVTLPLPAGVTTGSVYWSKLGGSGFDPIGGTIDTAARTITVTTAHFSQAVIGQASETRTISGVGQTTWASATTRQNVPIDFATQGVEAFVRDTEGNLVSIAGVPGAVLGTFTIPGVPAGQYILHSGTTWLTTESNTPDLGFLRGGRPDRKLFTSAAIAHIAVDGLEAWEDGSQLELYVSEADDWDFQTDLWADFQPGDTSKTFAFNFRSCNGGNCAEIGMDDHAILAQLSPRTSSTGVDYFAMSRLIEFQPFSLASGGSVNLSGTMRDVSEDHSIAIDFRGSQWGGVVAEGHPMAETQCVIDIDNCFVALLGQGGSAEDGFYTSNADPLFLRVDGQTDIQSGTLKYGTLEGIAAGSWGLLFDVRVGAGYFPAPLPGSIGLSGFLLSRGAFNGIEWTANPSVAEAGPVVPPLSMVRSPKIADQDLFTATSNVGLTPTITWTEPALGHAVFYRVDVSRLVINAQNRTVSQRVASLITPNTSVDLPAGMLEAGVHYMIGIAAVGATSDQSAALLADAPFKSGIDRVTTTLTSGVFTP